MMVEGYFDESGSFDEEPRIFCISGYFVESASAAVMDHQWGTVLEQHGLPYFHMVDCAHGTGVFTGKSKQERTEIVTKLIAIIKRHTIEGFSVLARRDEFAPSPEESQDVYSVCAAMAVNALAIFLETHRIKGQTAFFFEDGHKSQGKAYEHVARRVQKLPAKISFGKKDRVKLLQAADLLAWQTRKYASDKQSAKRPPRRDFESLMQHRHAFVWMSARGADKSLAVEQWPMVERSAATSRIEIDGDGPLTFLYEGNSHLPIIPISDALGWRLGAGGLVQVAFRSLGDKEFCLAFEQRRLNEAILSLVAATEAYAGSGVFPIVPAIGAAVAPLDSAGSEVVLRIQLGTGSAIAFRMSKQHFHELVAGGAG